MSEQPLLRSVGKAQKRRRVLGSGVDLVALGRFSRVLEVGGQQFLERIYTATELSACHGRLPQLARRFAAKEAVAKALGTGIRDIGWNEMEILVDCMGRPTVRLSGRAAARAQLLGIEDWAMSLTSTRSVAVATAVATGEGVAAERPLPTTDHCA